MPDEDPRAQDLLDQSRQLDETRSVDRRFYATWALGGLAMLLAGASILLANKANSDNANQAKAIADTSHLLAEDAKQQSEGISKYLRGEQGLPGVPGSNGQDGTPGLPGSSGSSGTPGPKGNPGPKGDAGPAGDVGPSGATGPPGPIGTRGLAGAPGAQGASGSQGAPGDRGANGSQGAAGDTGANGDPGSQGDPGPAGAQGDPGPAGAQGDPGPAGPPGPPGPVNVQATLATSDSTPDDIKSATAVCPDGTVVISGGYIIQGPPSIAVTTSATAQNGWLINASETAPIDTDWSIQAIALCAQQPPSS